MKIVLINDRLNAGGAEKVLVFIANLLHKNNIDVSVVLLLDKAAIDNQIETSIPVHYIKRKSRFSFKAFFKLKELVKNVDIVHIHSRYNLRYYMVAKWLTGINAPKIFFHEHVPSFKIDFFTKFLFGKVNAYVAVQNQMKLWAISNKMLKQQNAFYLPNTVDAPLEQISYTSNSSKIIMVGNYRPQKNHHFAVTLLKHLPANFTLDIYGMIDDEAYYKSLQNHIMQSELEGRVNLVLGITNIYGCIHKYKFALHTSVAETGPLVLVEYLYAKLPFITYNTGDVVDVINKQLPHYIVNSFEIDDWIKAIDLLIHPKNTNAEKEKMEEIIKGHFSENAYLEKLLSIYTQILA